MTGSVPYAYKRTQFPTARKKRNNPEHKFQVSVAKYLRFALPSDWRFTASAAGVYLGEKLSSEMKAAGQHPGWSDLILRQVGTGETRWMECKSLTGLLSPAQRQFRDDCPRNFAEVDTLEDVEAALIRWGITPRCTIAHANRYHINSLDPGAE